MTRPRGSNAFPAIAADYADCDWEAKVLSKPYDGVTSERGRGRSGYRVEVVEYDCPAKHCSHDRMIRRHDVNAEAPDEVRYWCLNPNCAHFVADTLSHACRGSYPQGGADEPAVVNRE
jgi:hypothetical protein